MSEPDMGYPAINVNPIVNGVYQWGDVFVEISPDASEVTISHGGDKVYVHGGFFQDVVNVLAKAQQKTTGEQSSAILLNCTQTSRSLPTLSRD